MSQGSPQGDENGYNSVPLRSKNKTLSGLIGGTSSQEELFSREGDPMPSWAP